MHDATQCPVFPTIKNQGTEMKRTFGFLLSIVSLLLLWSCTGGNDSLVGAGGGDDFPSSVEAMGSALSQDLAQYDTWDTTISQPLTTPDLASQGAITLPTLSAPSGLSKTSASAAELDTTIWDSTDTAQGIISAYRARSTDTHNSFDTLAFSYTPNGIGALISATGRVYNKTTIQTDRYWYHDADGDGILLDTLSATNRVAATFTSRFSWNATMITSLTVGPGSDRDFSTREDNPIFAAHVVQLLGNDTVEAFTYTNADSDPYVFDPQRDSSVIDIAYSNNLYTIRPLLHPFIAQERLDLRTIVFPTTTKQSYMNRYGLTQKRKSGREVCVLIVSPDGDSTFAPKDTAHVIIQTFPALNDTLASDSTVLTILTGDRPFETPADSLLSVYHIHRSTGPLERTVELTLRSDTPVRGMNKFTSGSFSRTVTYADGAWIEISGTFTNAAIEAQYEKSNGMKGSIVWSRAGGLISHTKDDAR